MFDVSSSPPDPATIDAWLAGDLPETETEQLEQWFDRHPEMLSALAEAETEADDDVTRLTDLPDRSRNDPALSTLIDHISSRLHHRSAPPDPDAWREVLQPSDDPAILGTLDHYEVLSVIATGGMGIVLKARDPQLDRIAALKVLSPELAAQATARARFLREARAAARLEHDHILPIYGVYEEAVPYFAMRYAGGGTLQRRLDGGEDFTFEQVKSFLLQIASALAAAHQQNLIHRDIKPANIVFAEDSDRLWVCDFGIARSTEDPSLTYPGTIAGTPQYMSPEQAIGAELDLRSDLYSLGAVIYQCAYREPLHAGGTTVSVLKNIADAEKTSEIPRGKEPHPRWFRRLLSRLVSHDREDRPGDADEVIAAVENEFSPIPKQHRRRARKALIGSTLAGAVLLVLGLLLSSDSFRFEMNSRLAVRQGKGFFLSDRIGVYPRFAAAVAAAENGATVYLPEGETRIDHLRIPQGKHLRMQPANPESRCLLTTSIAGAPGIVTASPLEMDQVDLEVYAKLDGEAVVVAEGVPITIRNSRVSARGISAYSGDGWKQAAVSLRRGASLRMKNCELRLGYLDAIHCSMVDTEIELSDTRIAGFYGIRLAGPSKPSEISVRMKNVDFTGRTWIKAEVGHYLPELTVESHDGTFVTSGPLGWIRSSKKVSLGKEIHIEGTNNRWLPGNNLFVVGESGRLQDADGLFTLSGFGNEESEMEERSIRLASDGREFETLEEAFEQMPDGDTLLLSGMIFVRKEILVPKKDIHLRAADGARPVIVAGDRDGHALFFYRNTTVEGIRFTRPDEDRATSPILGFRAPGYRVEVEDCVFDTGRPGFEDGDSRSTALAATSTSTVVVRRCLMRGGRCFLAAFRDVEGGVSQIRFEECVFIGNRAFDFNNRYESSDLTLEIDRCVFATLCLGRFHPEEKEKGFPVRWRVNNSVLDLRAAVISTYDRTRENLLRNLEWTGSGNRYRKGVPWVSIGRHNSPVGEIDLPIFLNAEEFSKTAGVKSAEAVALVDPIDRDSLDDPVTMGQLRLALDPSLQEPFAGIVEAVGRDFRVQ